MDPSTGQHQEMGTNSMENMLVCSTKERKPRPQPEEALKCPRCDSTNTKFCYYNNYSLSQPRYFCKSCRRYWTKGGTLRNVPVGGGCRKNRRQSSSSSSSRRTHDHHQVNSITNPPGGMPFLSYDSSDLTLAFARLQKQSSSGQLGFDDNDFSMFGNPNNSIHTSSSSTPPFLDALRSGFVDTQNHNLYYGYGNGCINSGDVGNNGEVSVVGEMMNLHYDHQDTKQEDHDHNSHHSKLFLGFPWQINGNGMYDLDSGRESWNNHGLGNSNWQGLINSPLM